MDGAVLCSSDMVDVVFVIRVGRVEDEDNTISCDTTVQAR